MTVQELAEKIGVSIQYIRWVIRQGQIKARKHGNCWLIDKKSADAFVDARKKKVSDV